MSVAIENFAIDLSRTEVLNGGRDLRIAFNENVYSASPLTASDFTVAGGRPSISGDVIVSGNTITLHFNEVLSDGDTITVGSSVLGEVVGNDLNTSADQIRINNDGTGYQACTIVG